MRPEYLDRVVVSTAQMQQIENSIFAAGMPVAALMEKVGGLISQRIVALFPVATHPRVGILVGGGHNGGDALVVARELHQCGYRVKVFGVVPERKELTQSHWQYVVSLGIEIVDRITNLSDRSLIIDGIFGFGLNREITGNIANAIDTVNEWQIPTVSIDLPSGIKTDTGSVLDIAIVATHTLCLGLWKLAFICDRALPYLGNSELIDIGLPPKAIERAVGRELVISRFTRDLAIEYLLMAPCPLLLDADALNIIAKTASIESIAMRIYPTIFTPHAGEFQRLFPDLDLLDPFSSILTATQRSQAIILLKGARTIVADLRGHLRVIADSTPALARGGSGDVLTGLIGGLLASHHLSQSSDVADLVATAAWWHSQAGIRAAEGGGEWSVDPLTLIKSIGHVSYSPQ